MKRSIKKETKCRQLSEFVKKTEKTKMGGMGLGGVYRNKKTGKDYLIKRANDEGCSSLEQSLGLNWRTWDEILAARFFKHAGVFVPNMSAVRADDGKVYVASPIIPGAKNCPKKQFDGLPEASKEPLYISLIMHCWLGNRDLINTQGENIMVDGDKRVFNVDLGATLFAGFRSLNHSVDYKNFNAESINAFLLDDTNSEFGYLMTSISGKIPALNKDTTRDFFSSYFAHPAKMRQYQLQGTLMIMKFSDQDIADLVYSTGHTQKEKEERLKILKDRKTQIIRYMKTKYGEHALAEEQLALELQRIFHKNGIFQKFKQEGGADAVVSFTSQFTNALKPKVTINKDGTITLENTNPGVFQVIKKLVGDQVTQGNPITITMPLEQFKQVVHQEIITNSLQAFFASHNYPNESGTFPQEMYKGDGAKGFRPVVQIDAEGVFLSLPQNSNAQQIKQDLIETFEFAPEEIEHKEGRLCVKGAHAEDLAHYLMDNTGVRKTAVISENAQGQILAGKLDLLKKGVTGYATAGGNSEHPYNAKRAAREEGGDEFGYPIEAHAELIPVGSTLLNKKKNIFLVPPGGTSDKRTPIGYMEFQDGSIRYYSFSEFRKDYRENKVKFDRSSVDLYLRHYQREIQKTLHELGIEGVLVHVAKKPEHLGKITLKPSIEGHDYKAGQKITMPSECIALINELLGKTNWFIETKSSNQGKTRYGEKKNLTRDCIAINEQINPAVFHGLLRKKLQGGMALQPESDVVIPEQTHIPTDLDTLQKVLLSRVDLYLQWRENKDMDDGRGYPLGFFTKVRHSGDFGQKRAENLREKVTGCHDLNQLIQVVQEHLGKDSRLNNHSLDTYCLEGIKGYKELFGIYDEPDLSSIKGREAMRDALLRYTVPMLSV